MRTRRSASPAPTNDLTRAKADMDAFGYCLVAGALSDADVGAIRARLEEQAAAERAESLAAANGPHADATNQWLTMPVNKGSPLVELITHPAAMAMARHVVGEDFLLTAYEAHIVRQGGIPQALHCDQWWLPMPVAPDATYPRAGSITHRTIATGAPAPADGPIWPPVKVNVMYMITDFTEANGGTRLVPGSHLSGRQPTWDPNLSLPTVAAEGKAGTAVIWEGRTWHAAGINRTDAPRIGLTATYVAPMFRQITNFTVGVRDEVLAAATPELKALLGFKTWNIYGATDDPSAAFIERRPGRIGKLP